MSRVDTESMFAGCGDDLNDWAEAVERRRTPDFEDAFASWGQVLAERKALDYHSCVECWRMPNCGRWESFTAGEGCGAFEVDRPMEVAV